ncbi:Prolyl 4-hydroxylase alpha subunit [Operophtera brumata]|uniref:Prolyl 4-hydroxylase alpha subunit n=1 Tax=Operophtera brumata TaxID=104452 RepID=A0A0L7KPQ0_OPEBR|nr:Prolyl 4-hydroxylase alpha subunit [Operophtera brumata]
MLVPVGEYGAFHGHSRSRASVGNTQEDHRRPGLLHREGGIKTESSKEPSEVESLLETHKRIIDDLDFYIEKEESRLKALKKHLNQYKKEHEKAMEDIPNYLGNPINAFTLIKRLTTDLDLIEERIKKGTDYIKNVTMNHSDVKYPTLEDLTGAAQALTRLQETYRLNVHELSEGILNGVVYR